MADKVVKIFSPLGRPLLLISFIFISLLLTLELLTRIYSFFVVNYDLEMFKYAREMKVVTSDLRGHIHQKNKRHTLMGVELKTDGFGRRICNAMLPMKSESQEQKAKILFLGDSVTLGWGVNSSDSYVCRLANQAPSFEIINAGVGNYNIQAIQAQFALEFADTPFRTVIYSFYTNDLEKVDEMKWSTEPRMWWKEQSYFYHFLMSTWHRLVWSFATTSYDEHYAAVYRKNKDFFLENLERLRADVEKNQASFIVLLLPDLNLAENSSFKRSLEDLEGELLRRGLQVVPVYRHRIWPGKEGWVSKQDAHPNPSIHQRISEVACEQIPWLCQSLAN